MPFLFSPETYPRAPLRKLVSYRHAERHLLTLTLDLGPDGVKIETHYPLPDGEELNLKLILGNRSLRVKGRVASSAILPGNRTASDIEFTDLSEESLATLQRICPEESPPPEYAFCRSASCHGGNLLKTPGEWW